VDHHQVGDPQGTRRGGVIGSNYADIWSQARHYALTPTQLLSPLAARPYDLRHAAVSLWLNSGVPAPDVANRAGHGVDVLLRVYASCIDGTEDAANQRIEAGLGHRIDIAPMPAEPPHPSPDL
jgi:hypothetical protein